MACLMNCDPIENLKSTRLPTKVNRVRFSVESLNSSHVRNVADIADGRRVSSVGSPAPNALTFHPFSKFTALHSKTHRPVTSPVAMRLVKAILHGTTFRKSLCKVCHSCRHTGLYGTRHGIFRLAPPDFIAGLVIGPVLFSVAGSIIPALVLGQSHCSFRAGWYTGSCTRACRSLQKNQVRQQVSCNIPLSRAADLRYRWFTFLQANAKPRAHPPGKEAGSTTYRLGSTVLCTDIPMSAVHWLFAVTVERDAWATVLQELQRHDGNTARLARGSDEALGVRVSVAFAFIALSLLDLGRGDYSPLDNANRVRSFSHVGIVPDDATGRWVSSGISCFPRPCIPTLPHTCLISPSSTLKTSMTRGDCQFVVVVASIALAPLADHHTEGRVCRRGLGDCGYGPLIRRRTAAAFAPVSQRCEGKFWSDRRDHIKRRLSEGWKSEWRDVCLSHPPLFQPPLLTNDLRRCRMMDGESLTLSLLPAPTRDHRHESLLRYMTDSTGPHSSPKSRVVHVRLTTPLKLAQELNRIASHSQNCGFDSAEGDNENTLPVASVKILFRTNQTVHKHNCSAREWRLGTTSYSPSREGPPGRKSLVGMKVLIRAQAHTPPCGRNSPLLLLLESISTPCRANSVRSLTQRPRVTCHQSDRNGLERPSSSWYWDSRLRLCCVLWMDFHWFLPSALVAPHFQQKRGGLVA
ncbi:hypothetical protein PR048_000279 [Dryococelus australis]|uniref:Uncharacterized protein n=1 Tax=Dryococelus australis TaxID=614101 RepID=A0ABQ9IE85_9NEOP|nr:hypothetical protein PR048_000279 [Dryococelus australis]